MRGIVYLVLISLIFSAVSAANENNIHFQQFLQGLASGYGLSVSLQFIQDEDIGEKHLKIDRLFKVLGKFGQLDPKNSEANEKVISEFSDLMYDFRSSAIGVVIKNKNLSQVLGRTISTTSTADLFLNLVRRKNLQDELKNVGSGVPDHLGYSGQRLGIIIAKIQYGAFFSNFLESLTVWFLKENQIIFRADNVELLNQGFDDTKANGQDLLNIIAAYKTSSLPNVTKARLIMSELEYRLKIIAVARAVVIKEDRTLRILFNEFLPVIFKNPDSYMDVIVKKGLLTEFEDSAGYVSWNTYFAGSRLAYVLEKVYEALKSKVSLLEVSPLRKLLRNTRKDNL